MTNQKQIKQPRDRRYRRWGSLRNYACFRVEVPQRTLKIIDALCNQQDGQRISRGAVIEKLAEDFAGVLRNGESAKSRKP